MKTTLTSNKHILIGRAHELQCFLREQGHVFVDGVVGDVFVGAVVERDEDVEEDCEGVEMLAIFLVGWAFALSDFWGAGGEEYEGKGERRGETHQP